LVIVITYFVYCGAKERKRRERRRKYKHLLKNSSGNYDREAAAALIEIDQIEEKKAEDNFTAGTVIELNRNYGDMRNAAPGDGTRVVQHYRAALTDLQEHPTQVREIDPLFMIDHIGDFIERNTPGIMVYPGGGELVQFYQAAAPAIRQETVEQRLAAAEQDADNRLDVVDNFLDRSRVIVDDTQNSHDSAVNVSLRKTLTRLRQTTDARETAQCIREARRHINEADIDIGKRTRALKALDVLALGAQNDTIGATDTEVFNLIWCRCDAAENAKNEKLMKDALVDSLADFYEQRRDPEGRPMRDGDGRVVYQENAVCVNGRCGRMLESIVLLDHDDEIGGAQTLQQHKSDVMEQVKSILHKEIEIAKSSDDKDLRDVARSYEELDVTVKPEAEAKFKDSVKQEIDALIDGKKEVLGSHAETIRQEAYVAVDCT
jgi:hypothetical protein